MTSIGSIAILCFTQAAAWPSVAAAAATYTSTTTVQPTSVTPGSPVTVSSSITAGTAGTALVDIEVSTPGGVQVLQQSFDNQSFNAGQTQNYAVTWNVPASTVAGTYAVKLGIFAPGWTSLYEWNDSAARIVVNASAAGSVAGTPTATSTAGTPVASSTPGATSSPNATNTPAPASASGTQIPATATSTPNASSTPVATATAGATTTPSTNASPSASTTPSATTTAAATATPSTTVTPGATTTLAPPAGPKDFGVNVAAAEFGPNHLPGTLGTDYEYPSDTSRMTYFNGQSLKVVRIPFLWERLQPTAMGPLSQSDVAGLTAMVSAAQASGEKVILDMHNYGRYYNTPLTEADAPKLNDAWTKLAQAFRGNPGVYGYELMNEPHDLPEGSAGWAFLAQSATTAIRTVDAQTPIIVGGYAWEGAWTWQQNNASLNVNDPSNHLLYAAHQYFDKDGTGTYANSYDADGTTPTIGVDRLQPFLSWLGAHNARGILTEYGVPNNDSRWMTVLDNFLAALYSNPNIQGGIYWASGPWWGSYPLSIEPGGSPQAPQMAILEKYPSHS